MSNSNTALLSAGLLGGGCLLAAGLGIVGVGALALAGVGGAFLMQATADAQAPAAEPAAEPAPAAPKPAPRPVASTPKEGGFQLQTGAAVQPVVDGRPAAWDASEGWVLGDLSAGTHQLEVRNVLGKTVATEEFTVVGGKRTRFQYKVGGRLTSLGTAPLAAPKPTPAPAPTVTTVRTEAPRGGFLFEDMPPATRIWVDGREVTSGYGQGAVLVEGLDAGTHEVRIEQHGDAIHDGGLSVRSNQLQRCTWGSWSGLSCHFVAGDSVPRQQIVWTSTNSSGRVVSGSHQVTVSVDGGSQDTRHHAQPTISAMSEAEFSRLLSSMQAQTFSDGKLGVLRTAASGNYFTVDQVGRALDTLTYDDDRVTAVGVVKDRIVDPQNAYQISDHFTYSSSASEAQALLQ